MASYQKVNASRKVLMKTSSENICSNSESSTIALPRGFQNASNSPVAPGILRVTRKRPTTPTRKIRAFLVGRLSGGPSPAPPGARLPAGPSPDVGAASGPVDGEARPQALDGLPLEHAVAGVGDQRRGEDAP